MTANELKKRLSSAPAPTNDLLDELYRYCNEKKTTPDTIISTLQPMVRAGWEAAMKEHPFKRAEKVDDRNIVNALIEHSFYVCRAGRETQSHELYPIRDQEQRLLGEPIVYDTLSASRITDIGFVMNASLKKLGEPAMFLEQKTVKDALGAYFMTAETNQPRPTIYAQPHDDTYCLARRTVEPDHSAAYPDWQRFLDGFEDPEAYAAKIYAIVTGQDDSRQALVTRSRGKTGKSCATAAITSIYGNDDVAKAITGTHVSQSSRFLASNYRSAALIYAPDCNVRTFLLSEVVKQLTGSDMVQYEIKGGAYGQYRAQAKLMVNMNPRPLILSEQHSITRILYLEQNEIEYCDMGSAEFTRVLIEQLPGMLAFGERSFEKRWRNKMCLLNERAQRTFETLVGGERQEFYDFVLDRFEFGEGLSLDGATFTKALNKKNLSQHQRDEWREWLEDFDSVEKEKTRAGKITYRGIGRRAGNTSDAADEEMDNA